jgi:hypothetical protein
MKRSPLAALAVALLVLIAAPALAAGQEPKAMEPPEHGHAHGEPEVESTPFHIPKSLTLEHQELHRRLAAVVALGGETGAAAREVEKALAAHFPKEEEYALPQLALLVPLAHGELTPDMRRVLPLVDRLRADLPEMLAEHKKIAAAAEKLSRAGEKEGKPEGRAFAEDLLLHARTEEEILYPAALLVGEVVRLRLEKP